VERGLIGRTAVVVFALSAAACGSRLATPPSLSSSVASAPTAIEVRDSSVDALPDPRVPTSPDIVLAAVEIRAGEVVFRLRHRPGTFDPATTRFAIDLDTDQNGSTGTSGVEYYVFVFPAGGRGADVARTPATNDPIVVTVPVTFVADGCDVAVPIAALGNDDGRFDFRVRVYAQPALPSVLDVLPDVGFARVN
jgi:hypothetical protein